MSIHEITEYLSLKVRIEYLLKISGRHKNLKIIQHYIHELIMDARGQMDGGLSSLPGGILPAAEPGEADPGLSELKKLIVTRMLDKFKEQFRPEDWFFLKAFLNDNNEATPVMIRHAQAFAPENGHIYASVIAVEKEKPEIHFDMADYFHVQPDDKALQNYLTLVKLLSHINLSPSEQSPSVILPLLKGIRLNHAQLYGLLIYLSNYAAPGPLLEVIPGLKANSTYVKRIYALALGLVHYYEKNYEQAAGHLLAANIETLPLTECEKTKYMNKMAWSFHHSGKLKKAAMIWRYIAGDPGLYDSVCWDFSDAVMQLARYYLSKGLLKDALDIMCNISEKAMDTIFFCGEGCEYYSLLGDICKAAKNYTDALGYYSRAYKYGNQEELKTIIREMQLLCE